MRNQIVDRIERIQLADIAEQPGVDAGVRHHGHPAQDLSALLRKAGKREQPGNVFVSRALDLAAFPLDFFLQIRLQSSGLQQSAHLRGGAVAGFHLPGDEFDRIRMAAHQADHPVDDRQIFRLGRLSPGGDEQGPHGIEIRDGADVHHRIVFVFVAGRHQQMCLCVGQIRKMRIAVHVIIIQDEQRPF